MPVNAPNISKFGLAFYGSLAQRQQGVVTHQPEWRPIFTGSYLARRNNSEDGDADTVELV